MSIFTYLTVIFTLSYLLQPSSPHPLLQQQINSSDYQTTSFTISSYIFPDPKIQFKVRVSSPTSQGTYPAIIFIPGFGALLPSGVYSLLLDRLAAKGYVVMSLSRFQIIDYSKIANQVGQSISWLKQNILPQLSSHDLNNVTPDWDQLILSSQSAGGHILSQRLNTTCSDNPKALVLLDPVDGVDPFGLIHDFIVPDPPKTLPFLIPTMILASEKSQTGGFLIPACNAPKMSNMHFYNGLDGPTWYISFKDFGHTDLLTQPFDAIGKVLCKGCSDCSGRDDYNKDLVNLMDIFIQGILQKNDEMIKVIEDPTSHVHSNVTNVYDLHGFTNLDGGFCKMKTNQLTD